MCTCICQLRNEVPKCLPHVNVKKNNNHQFENLCCYVLIYGFVVIINLWLRREQGSRSYSIRSVGKGEGRERETVGKILGPEGERGKEGKSALVHRRGRERASLREESEKGASSKTTGGWPGF